MATTMPELVKFVRDAFWIALASLVFSVLMLWLIVVGNGRARAGDSEAHAEGFAGVVREGHGGMTVFLWVSFALLVLWTVYYFVAHAQQFLVIFTSNG
jgi:hypothetical protein